MVDINTIINVRYQDKRKTTIKFEDKYNSYTFLTHKTTITRKFDLTNNPIDTIFIKRINYEDLKKLIKLDTKSYYSRKPF